MKMKTFALGLLLAIGGASAAYGAEAMACCKGEECCCKKHDTGAGEGEHKDMHRDKSEAKPEPKVR
jgi:hypothetical protein